MSRKCNCTWGRLSKNSLETDVGRLRFLSLAIDKEKIKAGLG